MTPAATEQDLAPGLERCFLFEATEGSYPVTGITGSIPKWLQGTYYVNGPARFERTGMRYRHWLDGDGMICALRFDPDGVHFTSRFVGTRKLREEETAGKFLYRGFGTAFPGDRLLRNVMLEPPVNVSVYPFAGSLLAFGEQTLPVELDPGSLETRGEYDFHGSLNEISPFAAHAKFDPVTGHMLNFGISFSATRPMLNVYEFDSQGHQLRRRRYPLEHQHSNHDFGISENHVVFFLSPLLMNFSRFWGEGASVMESLSWEPEKGSRILIAPRVAKAEAFQVPAGQGYCLHLINCFEQNNRLMVDILELEAPVYPEYQPVPDLFATVQPCRPVRYIVDLQSRTLLDRIAMDYWLAPDFPSINNHLAAQPYDDFWMLGISCCGGAGRKFFNQLAHGSWNRGCVHDIFETAPGEYLAGEPIYLANPEDPEEGVIIVERIDAGGDRAEFLLFDAAQVSKGPIARLPLRHKIHPGFHASFGWPASRLTQR